jgi:prepilin-type N-terminal cleavage/methylation domain-containing protein
MNIKIRNPKYKARNNGYTLIELIVAVGLFALVMTLASGAYIMMIGLTERAQGTATGIDNLSFALETMTRTIRTGTNYSCNDGKDCSGGTRFSVVNMSGITISYSLLNGVILQNNVSLTDPSVTVSSLLFSVSGTAPLSAGDYTQPHVTMIISGTVSAGSGKPPQSFSIRTGATMRGSDLGAGIAACTSWTYTGWGTCQPDNTQTRTVLTSNPAGCMGGNPILTQSCTYASPFSATGGTITYAGGYTIHTFTSSGTFTVTGSGNVEYLVVAGGGGGGSYDGGGGGGGGVRTGTLSVSSNKTVTVGNGGSSGAKGSDSVFDTITSIGGGLGGFSAGGGNGGSGGGQAGNYGDHGYGTSGQGYDGGHGATDVNGGPGGGGGGGAGAVGSNSTTGTCCGANGGSGTSSSISGSVQYYGGGGGGGAYYYVGPPLSYCGSNTSGGAGGGAGGNIWTSSAPVVGTANTGGGGGGGGSQTGWEGAAGGKGIVIVRYPTP